jgi:hypothetical protein
MRRRSKFPDEANDLDASPTTFSKFSNCAVVVRNTLLPSLDSVNLQVHPPDAGYSQH